MKKLLTLLTVLCMAAGASAAPKKDEKKDTKKPGPPPMAWTVVIEGAAEATEGEVKALLAKEKEMHVESITKKDATIEAVVTSKKRLSRSDISRALKENKALKVKDFKAKKPEKGGDAADKDKEKEKKAGDKDSDKKPGEPSKDKKPSDKPETETKDSEKPAAETEKKDAPAPAEKKAE